MALARNIGYSAQDLRRIRRIVEARQQDLLEAWHGYFGSERR
ncbi:DUF4160 domain-containing protein [Thioalkalivibrio paradoxus]|nr:DUF4160 domain-containing protein [Thioalkalivibrio paradoxus]